MTYQHTADDLQSGYLPYDGMGRPISRRRFAEILATAPTHADPEDLDNPSTVSLDYARKV